jgi:multiple antibiotic resistance protein
MFAIIIKNTVSLLALVDPLGLVPLFLAACAGLSLAKSRRFAVMLGGVTAVGLGLGGVFGMQVLSLLGVSMGAMQVAGGLIALSVAFAMVLGQEQAVRKTPAEDEAASSAPGIVPLGIPLLVGPASLSFMMANAHVSAPMGWVTALTPALIVGVITTLTFVLALRVRKHLSPVAMSVVEKLVGFLLAALAIELVAAGVRALFLLPGGPV